MSSRSLRAARFLLPLVLVLASTLAAFGAAEAFLRLNPHLLPEEARLRLHWRSLRWGTPLVDDPYIGLLYPAGFSHEIARGDMHFVMQTDSRGFRNASEWPEAADIVVLGDSMAAGYGVNYEDAWLPRLAAVQPGIAMVNLGVIGASPPQYARIFERYGVALAPRLVLFCLFPGNDVVDAIAFDDWQRQSPGTTLREWLRRGDRIAMSGLAQEIVQRSHLAMLVVNAAKAIATSPELQGHTLELRGGGRVIVTPGIYKRVVQLSQPGAPGRAVVMQAIEHTRALASQSGARLLVLLFPTKEDVYLPVHEQPAPVTTVPYAGALRDAGIDYLDLTLPLQQAARSGAQLYFEVDGHPNAAGYAVVADAVAAWLRENRDAWGIPPWR